MQVARYRERHSTSAAKSDAADAHLLAEIVRLDRARSPPVPAYAASASALVTVLTAMVTRAEVLAGQVKQGFGQHPDVEIYRSQPGLGAILGARVLAEFGKPDPRPRLDGGEHRHTIELRRNPAPPKPNGRLTPSIVGCLVTRCPAAR